jgi:hypothetical protein
MGSHLPLHNYFTTKSKYVLDLVCTKIEVLIRRKTSRECVGTG